MVGPDRRVRWCESFLEKNVFSVIVARPDVLDLREQPAAVTYVDEAGRTHRHTFDAIVEFRDGLRLAVVVKRAEVAEREATKRLVALLALHLRPEVADGVLLMSEDDAGPDAMYDARLVNSARLHPDPVHDAKLRDHLRRSPADATVAELCRDSGLHGFGLRAIARLLFDGTLTKASPGRIASSTLVRVALHPGART